MTTQEAPEPDSADLPTDRMPLNRADRAGLGLIFGGIAILLAGLALPTLRVLLSDGHWLAVTPCTIVTGLGTHLSGGDPEPCGHLLGQVPVASWFGNLHNRNLVAWGVGLFMIGILSTGGVDRSDPQEANE